jgi:hypothetical protein
VSDLDAQISTVKARYYNAIVRFEAAANGVRDARILHDAARTEVEAAREALDKLVYADLPTLTHLYV